MPAVPESGSEFQDPQFWKEFYQDSRNAFEWYGDFNSFGPILIKYIKPTDKILQIGCGNSEFADQLYDNGYRSINNIDIDRGVINKQIARNIHARPELQFSCCSASEIDCEAETYNVILDKGTLDALMPTETGNAEEEVAKMFAEICRVLTVGGRYIVITLAQKQVLSSYLSHFLKRNNFMIRIEKNNDAEWKFPMPVFMFIATKLRVSLRSPYIELILSPGKKATKFSDQEDLISTVIAEQEFSRFCHLCSKKLKEEVSMILYGEDGKPRYQIAVVDDQEINILRSFAVFIIPVGRDGDWIFGTEKGRSSLRKQCKKNRLAVVTLYRDQKYENMEQVKDELRPYMLQLAPETLQKSHGPSIEYLSLGEVDVKKTRASGHSIVNGSWTVEDVRITNSLYRRLVFLSSQNLVQSEAKLIRNKKGREIVDLNTLTSEYHEAMLTALPFMLPSGEKLNRSIKPRLLILGLGGGVLPSFLHLKFPLASVVTVELDREVAQIAKDWFSLNCDSNLTVVIKDALTYIEELVEQKNDSLLFDAIFVDVAGGIQENGLSCPLPSFVTAETLQQMHSALRERGVLALNLVTRNNKVAAQVKKYISSIFSYYFVHCSEEDINQVLICPKVRVNLNDAKKACEHLKNETGSLGNIFSNVSSLKICEE